MRQIFNAWCFMFDKRSSAWCFSFLVSVSGVSTVGHTFYKHMFQLVPEARKLPLGGLNRRGFMLGVNRWLTVPHMYTDQKDISTLGLGLLFLR